MKLKHKILCVDDDIDSLEQPKDALRSSNNNVGIKTIFIDYDIKARATESPEQFRKRIENDLQNMFREQGFFDLILVDWHMQDEGDNVENPIKGTDIIKIIRDNHTSFRPIIFYSGGYLESKQAHQELQEAVKDEGILGQNILICERNDLPSTLKELTEEMHKEEHQINNVRGLLMDQMSEIDALHMEIIKKLWPKIPENHKETMEKAIKKRAKNSYNTAEKMEKELANINFIDLPEKYICSSTGCDFNSRVILLRKTLKLFPELKEKETEIKYITDDEARVNPDLPLNKIRNLYAHSTARDLENEHCKNRLKYIREETRKHLSIITDIAKTLEKT